MADVIKDSKTQEYNIDLFLKNRWAFHAASRVGISTGFSLAQSTNVDGHIVTDSQVWTANINEFPVNTGDNKTTSDTDAATLDLVQVFKIGAVSGELNGGTVWTNDKYPAVKLFEKVPLTPVQYSDSNSWELVVDGVRISDWVAPTAVKDPSNSLPIPGFAGIIEASPTENASATATNWLPLGKVSNNSYGWATGNWQFVYMAGMVIFHPNYIPSKMGQKSLRITGFQYIGSRLKDTIGDIEDTIGNLATPSATAIELIKDADPSGALSGYAAVYTLKQGSEQIGTINIPKDQFLKSAEYLPDTNALKFVWNLADEDGTEVQDRETIVPVSGLVDTYIAGSGLTLSGAEFRIDLGTDAETAKYLGFDSTSALVIDGLDVAADGNYIKAANTVSGNLVALDTAVKNATHKHEKLTAFGKDYDTSAPMTISGQVVEGEKYIDYDQAEGIFTLSSTNLDVSVDGSYVKTSGTVATNLTALDTAVGELSGGTYISGDVVASDLKRLDAAIDAAIEAAEHTHVAGNAGIAVSETDGQVSISAVVKEGDLHLGIGETGIETSGLVTAAGNIISANVTVATNLEALDAEIGDLVSGNYISGDIVASDLKALDTQVKVNAEAIAANADAIANLIKDCVINITANADTTLPDSLGTIKVASGVVTIVFKKEVLEIGQREAAKGVTLSGKFEDVYPDEEFDTETKVTTLSADFGNYLDDEKTVQWRITYRG